jgi:hypothetical protein
MRLGLVGYGVGGRYFHASFIEGLALAAGNLRAAAAKL